MAERSSWWGRLVTRFRGPAKTQARVYAQGAVIDRLSMDWRITSASTNQEIRGDIRELRRRARALHRDDPYVNGLVREYARNVIGEDGIRLHPKNEGKDGSPAERANRALVDAWLDWSHSETASTDRQMSFVEIQRQIVESLIVDGEYFVRLHSGFNNSYGFALELIDPDFLDEQYNRQGGPGANAITMGVETDAWNAPVAYHFWTHHPSEPGQRDRIRVPASEIIHGFQRKRIKQVRGVSALMPIIFRLKMLGAYEDAEVNAARTASAKMGFLTTDPTLSEGFEAPAANEKILWSTSPGEIEQLPPGVNFTPWDPQHPTAAFREFVNEVLRSIAVGAGVSYITLTGDLNQTSYSSARVGLQSERDGWKAMQKLLGEHFHRRVYRAWLDVAVLTPALSALPSKIAERWHNVEWRGRGWKWVDPLNDMKANEMALSLGLTSRQRICAEIGVDYEENLKDLAREQQLADEYKVDVAGMAASAAKPEPVDAAAQQQQVEQDQVTADAKAKQDAEQRAEDDQRELRILHAVTSTKPASPTVNVTTPDINVDVRQPDVNVAVTIPPTEGKTVTKRINMLTNPDTGACEGYELVVHETRDVRENIEQVA